LRLLDWFCKERRKAIVLLLRYALAHRTQPHHRQRLGRRKFCDLLG
jgi:hypothetical protein